MNIIWWSSFENSTPLIKKLIIKVINPNKSGLFEGIFSWEDGEGGQSDPHIIFQEELI